MIFNIFWEKKLDRPQLLFQGNFLWLQNTEAAQYLSLKVFPEIKKIYPNATLIIAGQNISKIKNCFGLKVIIGQPYH